jgi:hypothetical protein
MNAFARSGVRQVFLLSAAVGGVLWVGLPTPAQAEVTITGVSNDARVEASNASLEELLSALHDKFDLSYKSSAPLDHKVADGILAGPLTKILAPLLKDYDHITKVQDGRISIVFTNQQKSRAKPTSTVLADPSASSTSEPTVPAASGVNGASKNEVAADSKTEKVVAPNGALPPPAPPAPSPFAVTTFLETQAAPFMNRASTPANAAPPSPYAASAPTSANAAPTSPNAAPMSEGVGAGTSNQLAAQQAAIAQTMQRANVAVQALVGALGRLPQ